MPLPAPGSGCAAAPRAEGCRPKSRGAAGHTTAKEAPHRNAVERAHEKVVTVLWPHARRHPQAPGRRIGGVPRLAHQLQHDAKAHCKVRLSREPRTKAPLEGKKRATVAQSGPTEQCARPQVALYQPHRVAQNLGSFPQWQACAPQPEVRRGRESPTPRRLHSPGPAHHRRPLPAQATRPSRRPTWTGLGWSREATSSPLEPPAVAAAGGGRVPLVWGDRRRPMGRGRRAADAAAFGRGSHRGPADSPRWPPCGLRGLPSTCHTGATGHC